MRQLNSWPVSGTRPTVFDVKVEAYWAGCLAGAAQNWRGAQAYCDGIAEIMRICREINMAPAAASPGYLKALASQVKLRRIELSERVLPDNLELRPGARLGVVARVLSQARKDCRLWPPISPESADRDHQPSAGPAPTPHDGFAEANAFLEADTSADDAAIRLSLGFDPWSATSMTCARLPSVSPEP